MASGRAKYRLTVGRLMGLIAAFAALLAAGIYRQRNLDADRAVASADLWSLQRGDATDRRRAAIALGEAGRTDPAVLAALVEATAGDGSAEVRAAAVAALGRLIADSAAVRFRKTPKPNPVLPLADELATLRLVVRALDDPAPEVSRAAMAAFARSRPYSKLPPAVEEAALAALNRRLDDADPLTRMAAVHCLGRMIDPPSPAEVRGRLIALAERDSESEVRLLAIQALVQRWPSAELYPILLARRAAAPTAWERDAIVAELGQINAPPPGAVLPTLLDLMATDAAGAIYVPFALSHLGAGARPYFGALGRLATIELQGNLAGPHSAIQVLAQLDPTAPEAQAAVIPLARQLRDATDDPLSRSQPGWLLQQFGPAAAPAVPTLREALHSPIAATRLDAAQLLSRIGPAAEPASGDLEPLGRADPDPAVRAAAARALDNLRPAAPTP